MQPMIQPWREYVRSLASGDTSFERAFSQGEVLLSYLAGPSVYGLQGELPRIMVSSSPLITAYATPSGEIHFCQGFLNWASQLIDFPRGQSRATTAAAVTESAIQTVLAHEFFHIGRSHQAVEKRISPNVLYQARLAFEFDADQLAVASIYRWIQKSSAASDVAGNKEMVLRMFYWPIREMVGSRFEIPRSPHPPWIVRLYLVVRKLAYIDTRFRGERQISKDYYSHHQHLIDVLRSIEAARMKAKGESTSIVNDFLAQDTERFAQFITDIFVQFEPQIMASQRFKGLR